VVNELHKLHDNFVLVSADKPSNNIVFISKNYYYQYLLNELGFTSTSGTSLIISWHCVWFSYDSSFCLHGKKKKTLPMRYKQYPAVGLQGHVLSLCRNLTHLT
jgi:hypothetical protein